jgi:hypothetical protein
MIIWVQYSVGPSITILGRITASVYVYRLDNQVRPMTETLFANNNAVLQNDNAHIHTAGTV